MAIETTAVFIKDLNKNYPLEDDYISEGDDHIKLIKSTLQNTFPNQDVALTPEFSYLNSLPDYMDLTSSVIGGVDQKEIILQGVKVSGAVNATASDGLVTLSQMQSVITTVLQQSIYRVGSYYFSDDNTNPRSIFGFGVWNRVAGFVAGSGSVVGGTGVNARNLTVGQTGGHHAQKVVEGQIPRLTQHITGTTGNSGPHKHDVGTAGPYNGGPVRSGITHWPGSQEHRDGNPQTLDGGDHTHQFDVNVTLGHADPSALDNMPPFTVTNVWKRIS